MRYSLIKVFSFIILVLVATSALATQQSTINTTIPVQGSPVTSAPVRNNFTAAANDINNLYSLIPNIVYPISVSNGGTGVNSLAANNLLVGNGAGAVNFLSPVGQSGNCIVSNGTSWVASSACGGGGGGSGTVTTISCNSSPSGLGCNVATPTTTPVLSFTGTLSYTNGGTGLNNLGANGTCVGSNGSSTSWVSCSGGGSATPGGSANAIQYNNGSGGFAGLNTANNAFLFLSNNGTSPQWSAPAGLVDPRTYGAACVGPGYTGGVGTGTIATAGTLYTNGTYTTVPLTGGSGTGAQATITVSGGSVTAVTISIQGSGYKLRDVLSASAASIGGTGSGFTYQVATLTGSGLPVWDGVHDATAAFQQAFLVAQNTGQAVLVPDGCWVSNTNTPLQIPQGVVMWAEGFAPSYGYDILGGTAHTQPVLYVIGHPTFGIQFGYNANNGFVGFEVNAAADPAAFSTTTCIGTATNDGGGSPSVWMHFMSVKECNHGFGGGGSDQSTTFFLHSDHSQYGANNWGIYGHASDLDSLADTFNSEYSGGVFLSGYGGEARFDQDRFEYLPVGLNIYQYGAVQISNTQFDHNYNSGLYIGTVSSDINISNTLFTASGSTGTSGNEAHITVAKTNTGPLNLYMSNTKFSTGGASYPKYDIESTTSFANNDYIGLDGGDASSGSIIDKFNWQQGQPPHLIITHVNGMTDSGTIANGAIPAQARGLPSNNWSGMYVFGDPTSYNTTIQMDLSKTWGSLVAKQLGTSPVYYVQPNFSGYTCDIVETYLVPNTNPQLQGNPLVTWLPDTTDPSFGNGYYQNHLTDTKTCVTGGLTWASISQNNKVLGQSSTVTTTGTWANSSHYTMPTGITSQTNGSTAAIPLTTNGGPVYIWFLMNSNNGGTFSYNIDGSSVLAGTAATQGQNSFTYRGGAGCGTACYTLGGIRIPGVVAGSHTVNITVTSSTNSSNTVTIEGVGTAPLKAYASTSPVVVVGGQIPDSNFTQASTDFNTAYFSLAKQLYQDGLQVGFADILNYWVPSTDIINFSGALIGNQVSNVGFQHISDAFNGAIGGFKNAMNAINPIDYGAACNSTFFAGSYSNTYNPVYTTANSNVITVGIQGGTSYGGYTFQPGAATQFGGGDVGKRICIGTGDGGTGTNLDVGPCTYIASVDVTTNSATLGAVMLAGGQHYAVMGGYPTNPNDPSTAADDTLYIQNAASIAAKAGGKIFLPTKCMVHNLTLPEQVTLEGNGPSQYYFGDYSAPNYTYPEIQSTILYCGMTGFSSDTPQCIQQTPHTLYKNFMMIVPDFQVTTWGISSACLGYSTNSNSGPSSQILTDHMSYFACPVAVGEAYGYNQTVDFTVSSVTPNSDGVTSTMVVSAITSTNFQTADNWSTQDFLGVGRTIQSITGSLFPANTHITAMPAVIPGTGNYTIDKVVTIGTSTPSYSSPFTGGMELRDNFSQYLDNGIAMNGDFTDSMVIGSVCTGTFVKTCLRMGPALAYYGNGGFRWIGGRMEEMSESAITCDGCGVDLTGVDLQFNGGYDILTLGSGDFVQVTGGVWYGGGTGSGFHDSMVRLGGNNPSVSLDGVALNGTSSYLFASEVGASLNGVVSVSGGNSATYFVLAGLTDWTNGTPTKYKQDVPGWPKIDTTQNYLSVSATGNVGIGTSVANTGSALDMGLTTTSVILPSGTTAQEPSPAKAGMFRWNTTKTATEVFNGILWSQQTPTPNAIGGLVLSNDGTAPNTTIDITRGSATSDDQTVNLTLTAALTTKTTGSFTAGTGNGCLDTGSVAASTWYKEYIIGGSSGIDILCSTNAYPLMPTGYTEKRQIGDFETDASSHILPFTQKGHRIVWTTPTQDLSSVTIGTSSALETLNVPPGEYISPVGSYTISNTGASVLWSDPATTDQAPTTANPFTAIPGFSMLDSAISKGTVNSNLPVLYTNLSGQLRVRASATGTSVSEITQGWDNPFIANSACNYTPPLDLVSGAYQAYGLRLLATNRLGLPIVQIRRASDNTTKDFSVFYPNCTIQQNDPFLSGGNYYISKWYDQSGNGNDITISSTTAQPQIILSCQNSQPCAVYNSSTSLTLAPSGANVGPMTVSAVVKTPASGGGNVASWGQGNPANQNSLLVASPNCTAHSELCSGGCPSNETQACSASTWYAVTANFSIVNNAQTMCVNGTCSSMAANFQSTLSNFASGLGTSRTAFTGDVSENIIFSPDISSTNYGILTTNQRAFWGF